MKILSVLLLFIGLTLANDIVEEYFVKLLHKKDISVRESLNELVKLGITSLEHPKLDEDFVYAYVSSEDLQQLERRGFQFQIQEHPALLYSNITEKRGAWAYHHYDDLLRFVDDMENRYPGIVRKFSIGRSTQNREIVGLRITKNPDIEEYEPELKYVANIHGDETVGREITIKFIEYLLENYNAIPTTALSQRITRLIDSSDLYIIPSLNPDGFELNRRFNYRGRDLNRNFKDLRFPGRETGAPEAETIAITNWLSSRHFVISGSYHGGAVVANYPYDGNSARYSGVIEASPDDDVFKQISLVYSNSHTTMHKSTEFHNGITNGAEWYVLYGGMQDWNYVGVGCFEVTLEISDIKYPPVNQLQSFWDQNREAMLSFLEQGHIGVRGLIRDAATSKPIAAKVIVHGRESFVVHTDPEVGDYYRLLLPGTYTLTASADNYTSQTLTVTIPQNQKPYDTIELNFMLTENHA